jgi:hypothetical protein
MTGELVTAKTGVSQEKNQEQEGERKRPWTRRK